MDWSTDGKLFVTEGTEETGIVDIRDAATGRTVQKFRADAIDLNAAAFTPDNRRVVTASDEGAIRVWDIATARKLGDLTVRLRRRGVGASPSALTAASWPAPGSRPTRYGCSPSPGASRWCSASSVPLDTTFSPDGRHLAVTEAGSGVHVIDVETHREVLFLRADGACDLAIARTGAGSRSTASPARACSTLARAAGGS